MKSIHLQGIGDVPAVPASALEPGMVRQYNYGATATILSVFRVSEKTLSLVEKSGAGRRCRSRRRGKGPPGRIRSKRRRSYRTGRGLPR